MAKTQTAQPEDDDELGLDVEEEEAKPKRSQPPTRRRIPTRVPTRYLQPLARKPPPSKPPEPKEEEQELDQIMHRANELRKDLGYLLDRHELREDATLAAPVRHASNLTGSLQEAGDMLKRANEARIRACVVDWYRFRVEIDVPEDQIVDPDIESITYKGEDRWEILMTTPTHGREKIIIDSDGASWDQVYDAQRLSRKGGREA